MQHVRELLEDPNYAAERATLIERIKACKYQNHITHNDRKQYNIYSYILRPIDSPILEWNAWNITQYGDVLKHLEYFPIVNTRVFNFGKNKVEEDESTDKQRHETKDIKNV